MSWAKDSSRHIGLFDKNLVFNSNVENSDQEKADLAQLKESAEAVADNFRKAFQHNSQNASESECAKQKAAPKSK